MMSQRRFGFLVVMMAIACSLLIALPAVAESNVRIVHLSYIDGDAQINQGNQDQDFTHAVLNMPVTAGMWLYTPNGGRAEVQFENGSTVRMANDAELQFERLALADSGGKINTIRVDHGIVYLNFDKVSNDDRITVNVGGKSFRITKSARLRVNADEKTATVAMFHGDAMFDGEIPLELKSNQTVSLDASATGSLKVAKGAEKIGSDSWNKDRDNDLSLLASRSTQNPAFNGYNAQFSSLGAYGNFYSLAGYGNVWQPFGMMPGWDPFSNGVWGLYPGMGYAFISPYPWGWAPYRYGQWNYQPANGWFWAPGSNFNTFNVGPSVGAVPAGWRAPMQPTVSGGTKPARLLVVGNPPNVHPAILTGHAAVGARPDTHPVAAGMHIQGSVMPAGTHPQPGTMPRRSVDTAQAPATHAPATMRSGSPSMSSSPSMHSSSGATVGTGHPKN
jgi:FecR protein